MNGYTKLFGTIVGSTVWELDPEVRVVWITMLAIANQYGEVMCSAPGLAKFAGVPRVALDRALAAFLAPDPDSRTKDHEGRRIEVIDGGWKLLNHAKYRHALSAEERRERDAERKREDRAEAKRASAPVQDVQVCPQTSAPVRNVTSGPAGSCSVSQAEADADPKADADPSPYAGVEPPKVTAQDRYRDAYERGITTITALPFSVPVHAQASLNTLTTPKYSSGKRGKELLEFIAALAAEFATAVAGEERFHKNLSPEGCLAWINGGKKAARGDGRIVQKAPAGGPRYEIGYVDPENWK